MPVLPLLAALFAAGAAARFRPDAQALFAGCRSESQGPNARFYACKDWSASIGSLGEPGLDRALALETAARAARVTWSRDVHEEHVVLKLAGRELPSLRFTPGGQSAARFAVSYVTLIERDERFRLVACTVHIRRTALLDRCAKVLEYFASKGVPEAVDTDQHPILAEPRILSHRLQIPTGCRLAGSSEVDGRIECSSSTLAWIIPEGIPSLDRLLENMVESVSSRLGGGFTDERLACRVEGQPARCARVSKDLPRGRVVTYIGVTTVDGHQVIASCSFLDAGAAFAPVCNGTLALP